MGTTQEWDELPPILTPDQVAQIAGVKPQQVLRWANRGWLAGAKIGRQWRFSSAVVRAGVTPGHGLTQHGVPDELANTRPGTG
jgi:excisionase family DNA binding protein